MKLTAEHGFFVLQGSVDLFVRAHHEHELGRRRPIGTFGASQLLWTGPSAPLSPDWRLLVVGQPGTELVRIDRGRLMASADEIGLAGQLDAIATAIGGPDRAGDLAGEDAAGGDAAGDTGTREPATGDLAGEDAATGEDGAGGTGTAGREPATGDRLDAAGQRLARVLTRALTRSLTEDLVESERIRRGPAAQQRRLESSLADLVDVAQGRHRLRAAPDNQLRQLDLVLAFLGDELGIELGPAGSWDDGARDLVVARVSRGNCRARVITLEEGWWHVQGLPILGFVDGGRRPVGLLPARRGYRLYDPANGTVRPVSAEVAAEVSRHAYTIYLPLPEAGSVWQLAKRSIGGTRNDLWVLLGLGTLAGIVTLLVPLATQMVYNSVLPNRDNDLLLDVSLLLFGAAIAWGLITFSQNLALVRISGKLEARLDPGLIDRLLQLPSTFFRRYSTGELATRANGLQVIRQQLSGAVVTSLLTLAFSLFNVVLLFIYSPTLGALSLAVLCVVVGVLVLMNFRVIRHQRLVYERTGEVATELFQVLQGIGKMRIANAATRLMARWAARFREQQEATFAAGAIEVWITAIITALPALVAVVLYAATAYLLHNQIPGGTFIALTTALAQFTVALTAMTLTLGPLLTVVPLWQRVAPILHEPVEEVGEGDPGGLSGHIEVRKVSFSYDDGSPPVLRDVSFDVAAGELIAITGPSGSGKSTMLRLLLGLDDPGTGTILYDGKDLRSLDGRAVRSQCGVVMQNARPLPGGLLDTILGDSGGEEEDAWAAARAADLEADIRRMPMGMHTIVGEGGLSFSGGQVQRMMIARALARQPKVLFFDEATSALDDRVQAQVAAHIDRMHVTRVVIAHRLSTIRHADRIYVLEAGRIVEVGTFDELMARDGTFRRLARRQML